MSQKTEIITAKSNSEERNTRTIELAGQLRGLGQELLDLRIDAEDAEDEELQEVLEFIDYIDGQADDLEQVALDRQLKARERIAKRINRNAEYARYFWEKDERLS